MLDVDIVEVYKGNKEEGNRRWKCACKRDMTEVGMKEGNAQTGQNEGRS